MMASPQQNPSASSTTLAAAAAASAPDAASVPVSDDMMANVIESMQPISIPNSMGASSSGDRSKRKRNAMSGPSSDELDGMMDALDNKHTTKKTTKSLIDSIEGDVVFSSISPEVLVGVFASIIDLNDQPILSFLKDQINFCADYNKMAISNSVLHRRVFPEYKWKQDVFMKVDGKKLLDSIKSLSTTHQYGKLYFAADSEGIRLMGREKSMDGSGEQKSLIKVKSLELSDTDFLQWTPKPVKYPGTITLASKQLQDIVRDISRASKVIDIRYSHAKQCIVFEAAHVDDSDSDVVLDWRHEIKFKKGVVGSNGETMTGEVRGRYNIQVLQKIVKQKISERVCIKLDHEAPALIEYIIDRDPNWDGSADMKAETSYVAVWLARRHDDDDDDESK